MPFQYDLLARVGRSAELDPKQLSVLLKPDPKGKTSEAHAWGAVMRWFLDKPVGERPAALDQLMEPHAAKDRIFMLAQFAMLVEEKDVSAALEATFQKLLDGAELPAESAKPFRMFFTGYQKNRLTELVRKRMADHESGDLAVDILSGAIAQGDTARSRFEAKIAAGKAELLANIGAIYGLYDSTLRLAADSLAPAQLDPIVKAHLDSAEPIDQLIAFLLLRQAGREFEALDALERIAALKPENPQAAAVRGEMPRILAHCGWETRAAPFLADANDDPIATTVLPFRLHDSLALLASSSGDALHAANRRVYAGMLMNDPSQFLRSAQIFAADKRHPTLAGNHSLYYRIRAWPSRIDSAPGGLLGQESIAPGSILGDLARVDGGEDELRRWTAGGSRETEIYRAIASNARDHGLSESLRNGLESADKDSTFNNPDIETMLALAAEAPRQMPASLAGKIPSLIASGEQKAANTAALGQACKALGMADSAKFLFRWSVALDIQNKGSSRWLGDYLAALPEEQRRDTLKTLLPYMGINAIRRDSGGDEAVLFTALLDLGMKEETNGMLDRYLQRLCLIDARSVTGSRFVTPDQLMTTGGEMDPFGGTLHDAMAVALARLDRQDDYRRVLARRAMLEQCLRPKISSAIETAEPPNTLASPTDFGTITGPPLEDLTRALPEPGQVADIQPYIDIHLEVISALRASGQLSREDHLARICMLGKWCAGHDLRPRAEELLKTAETLSTGMLTGRLWVADLHRLLGGNDRANAIELELLRHDLLPVSRVPGALAAVAGNESQDRADAIAYQVAAYSNHPQVLPQALRHARTQGLKEGYGRLAERLTKVATTFLPQGKKPSLTIPPAPEDWPAEEPSRSLAELANEKFGAISHVEIKGGNPKLIYVPIIHDGPLTHLSSNTMDGVRDVMSRCEAISDHLYSQYGVRNIVLEGLGRDFVKRYNSIPEKRRKYTDDGSKQMIVIQTWTKLLAEKGWLLLPASDKTLIGPLTELGYQYDAKIHKAMADAKEKGWFKDRKVFAGEQGDPRRHLESDRRGIQRQARNHPEKRSRTQKRIRHHRHPTQQGLPRQDPRHRWPGTRLLRCRPLAGSRTAAQGA